MSLEQDLALLMQDGADDPLASVLALIAGFEPLQDDDLALDDGLARGSDSQEDAAGDNADVDALLMEALTGMEEDDAFATQASGSQSASTTAKASGKAVNKPRRLKFRPRANNLKPNHARDQRKDELVYLRNRVGEMEAQLQELKDHGSRGAATALRLVDSAPVRTPRTMLSRKRNAKCFAFGWEAIAARQFGERHRAELENVRLKKMLEAQIKVAKDLEKVLKRRSNAQVRSVYSKTLGVLFLSSLLGLYWRCTICAAMESQCP